VICKHIDAHTEYKHHRQNAAHDFFHIVFTSNKLSFLSNKKREFVFPSTKSAAFMLVFFF